jgi:large subunit ribosomal protein L24
MPKKLNIKKDDTVRVIAGESKGQEGKVLFVDRKKSRVIVEGVNQVSKHAKPNAQNPQGGIEHKEASIHISNLVLIVNGEPTKVGRKLDDKAERLVRYSKKTGEIIK